MFLFLSCCFFSFLLFFLVQDGSLINFANWADWYVNHPSEDRTFVAWYKGSGTEQNHALPIEWDCAITIFGDSNAAKTYTAFGLENGKIAACGKLSGKGGTELSEADRVGFLFLFVVAVVATTSLTFFHFFFSRSAGHDTSH